MEKLKCVRMLLDAMNQKICYCHWKSNQHFEDALTGIDDLDILIDRNQYGCLLPILEALHFKRFYTPAARTYIGIEDYLGFDEDTGCIVHLHLHCQLAIGEKHLKGFHIPLENRLLKNRVWNDAWQVYLADPYDELLLLTLRMGLKYRKRDAFRRGLSEKSAFAEYRWLKAQCPDFTNRLSNETWLTDRVRACIETCYDGGLPRKALGKLKRYLYSDLSCCALSGGLGNTIQRHWREYRRIVLEVKKRFLHTRYTFLRRRPATGGVTIAFLGADGSGKSSSIAEMEKWLSKVMDVRVFYLGSGDGKSSALRLPLVWAKKAAQRLGIIKKANNFYGGDMKEKTHAGGRLKRLRTLWVLTLSRERLRKLRQVNRCRMRGFVVLTDRFPQSEFEGLCDGPKLRGQKGAAARAEAAVYRSAGLCPPDIAIKLIVSPEMAVKRKPDEVDPDVNRALTERIRRISFSDRTRCFEIDADQPQQAVWLEIKRAIWQSL